MSNNLDQLSDEEFCKFVVREFARRPHCGFWGVACLTDAGKNAVQLVFMCDVPVPPELSAGQILRNLATALDENESLAGRDTKKVRLKEN